MKPETEIRLFGFIDPMPPVEGSWKAEIIKLVDQAEALGDEALEACVAEFAAVLARTRQNLDNYLANA